MYIGSCSGSCRNCDTESECVLTPGCEWCETDWRCISRGDFCGYLRRRLLDFVDNVAVISNLDCSVEGYLNLSSTNNPNHQNDTIFPSTSIAMTGQVGYNASDNNSENTVHVVFSIGAVDFTETTILFAAVVLLLVLLCCVTLMLICRVCSTKKENNTNNKQNELQMTDIQAKGNNVKQDNRNDNNNNSNKVNDINDSSKLSDERKPSLEIVFSDSEPEVNNIALPNVNMHSLIVTSGKESIKQNNDNDSIDNSDLDSGVEGLFGEYTIEGEKHAHVSKSDLGSKTNVLSSTRSKTSKSKRSVLNVRNQINNKMEASGAVSIQ